MRLMVVAESINFLQDQKASSLPIVLQIPSKLWLPKIPKSHTIPFKKQALEGKSNFQKHNTFQNKRHYTYLLMTYKTYLKQLLKFRKYTGYNVSLPAQAREYL